LGGDCKGQAESLEQPECQQRLDDQAAGEGIETEQRCQLVDHAARRPKRGWRWAAIDHLGPAQLTVDQSGDQPAQRVEHKHGLEGR
jgi:hypothetical protein